MKIRDFLENFILLAILLVIIHTFLYEVSIYYHWSVNSRNILIYSGLIFDLIFTIEFFIRTTISAKKQKKGFLRYWFYERGWVDFLSSVPLLLFDSGPSVYILLSGATAGGDAAIGTLNVLKVVKAIRVTRILRLVRILKVFGKIHNTESKMAQHHTATISTISVFTIVLILISFSLIGDGSGSKDIEKRRQYYQNIIAVGKNSNKDTIVKLLKTDLNILKIERKNKLIYDKIPYKDFIIKYSHEDYIIIKNTVYRIYVNISDIHKGISFIHLQNFFIIIFLVLGIMFIYTRHFAQNISDIIHILNKGFRKRDYNLQIKIRDEFRDEELFKLAKFYNDAYLPAKLRRIHEEEQVDKKSALSMDDLSGFSGK